MKEEHTSSGAHRVSTISFPRWVPPEVRQEAENISEEEAPSSIGRLDQAVCAQGASECFLNASFGQLDSSSSDTSSTCIAIHTEALLAFRVSCSEEVR